MPLFQSFLLGLLQGITEFLPVSSSGHSSILQSLFGFQPSNDLNIFLHLATLFSVLFFFKNQQNYFFQNLRYIFLGSLPAAFIGLLFKDQVEAIFSSPNYLPLFFLITSASLLLTRFFPPKNAKITYLNSFIIGLAQALALLPGVSRSGATISTALILGLSPTTAFQFSFCLFIPATVGAVILGLGHLSPSFPLIISFLAAFITGLVALKLLQKTLITRYFWLFGLYTLALALYLFIYSFQI